MLNFTTEFAKFYTEQHKDLLTKSVNPFKSVKRIFPNGPRKLSGPLRKKTTNGWWYFNAAYNERIGIMCTTT